MKKVHKEMIAKFAKEHADLMTVSGVKYTSSASVMNFCKDAAYAIAEQLFSTGNNFSKSAFDPVGGMAFTFQNATSQEMYSRHLKETA